MVASRRVRQRAWLPLRSSGEISRNGPSRWVGGGGVAPSSLACSCGGTGCADCALVWPAGPGSGMAVGGSHLNIGYGYGPIGPNGPDRGNWPFLPGADAMWWGNGGAGGSLLPAVTRLTTLIVSTVVRTRWRLLRGRTEEIPLPLWVTDPQLAGGRHGEGGSLIPITHRLDQFGVWSTLLTHALWWGRAGFAAIEGSDGQPLAGSIRILNPFLVGAGEHGGFVLDPGGDDPLVTDADGRVRVGGRDWRVVVLRGLPPHDQGDHFGGVLVRHAATFGVGAHIQSYSRGVFHQGVPAGVLKVSTPNFGAEEAQTLRAAWERAHGGDRRGVAILNAGVDFSPVSLSPVETDLDRVRRGNLMDVAHAFGVSSAWLDIGGDSLTYANMVDRRRDLLTHSLEGFAAQFTEALSSVLPIGQHVEIAWSDYTAASLEESVPVLVQAVQAGVMTVDEARRHLRLPPMSAGGPDAGQEV
jgi:hypothetical protein